ncbi:zinc finger matrin-type protein 5 [Musca domestica]|uniref:Zinc finger matrin-type protein 5 n=1 Tax=Musca domestica TaxID=7370 RepID=A0A1I8N319_MUSDO|nr:zinc finger matrin-type protein 5 [Musca domestica]
MGGKRYYCDYCQCFMINDIKVRKTHNDSVSHKTNKIRCMRKFDDPRKVYEEEIAKPTCRHFLRGYCRFDLYCQSSHYTQKELDELRLLGTSLEKKENNSRTNVSGITSQQILNPWLPWTENVLQKKKRTKKNLPPSLRPINLKKLKKIINDSNSWG